ncbi:Bacterial alpha-L-rhamnosidase [compost metagenome]
MNCLSSAPAKYFLTVLLAIWAVKASPQSLKAPSALRVDLLLSESPLGRPYPIVLTANQHPYFTWVMNDLSQGSQQTAYRILVSSTPENLSANMGDAWDSGKVSEKWQPGIPYKGNKLKANSTYYWKVMVWNNKSMASAFSKPTAFTTGAELKQDQTAFHALTKWEQLPSGNSQLNNNNIRYDFGKAAFGQFRIKASSSTGTDTLRVHIGEAITATGQVDRAPKGHIRYRLLTIPLKSGTHNYEPKFNPDKQNTGPKAILMPEYIGEVLPFRYAEIEANKNIRIDSVWRNAVNYPFDDDASSFKSSDTLLNQVWALSKHTIKATSFTGLYVDGDRERIPYEADVLINQLSHYAVDAEFNMVKRSLAYLIYHATWPTEWSLQNLLIGWNDYLYSGDIRAVKVIYPQLKAKLLLPLGRTDGLISTKTGKQDSAFTKSIYLENFNGHSILEDIVDWPQKGGFSIPKDAPGETDGFVFTAYNSVVNAFHYQALISAEKIARKLGETKDANFFATQAAKVKLAFQRAFIDPETGIIKDGEETSHSSLHANMFALAFNLVPENNKSRVLDHIRSRGMACSVYGAQFLLDGLYDNHEAQYALKLLTATDKRSWYNMLRSGATMTTEAWDTEYKKNQDWNHAWGAAPANIIVRKLMGVEPLSPAFGSIQIKPQPGTLNTAELQLSTLRGKVEVAFTNTPDQFLLQTTTPPNSTGIVYLPRRMANDRILKNGRTIKAIPEGKFWKIANVEPGVYSWEVKYL